MDGASSRSVEPGGAPNAGANCGDTGWLLGRAPTLTGWIIYVRIQVLGKRNSAKQAQSEGRDGAGGENDSSALRALMKSAGQDVRLTVIIMGSWC
jgi:hypothetical protein